MGLRKFKIDKFFSGMKSHGGSSVPAHLSVAIIMNNLPDFIKFQLEISRLRKNFQALRNLGGKYTAALLTTYLPSHFLIIVFIEVKKDMRSAKG